MRTFRIHASVYIPARGPPFLETVDVRWLWDVCAALFVLLTQSGKCGGLLWNWYVTITVVVLAPFVSKMFCTGFKLVYLHVIPQRFRNDVIWSEVTKRRMTKDQRGDMIKSQIVKSQKDTV